MSLIQTYHTSHFGIVCSDGRVSLRWTDGHRTAVPGKTARKFIVLRGSPGLVLAGSSSMSQWLDFSICEVVRRYIEDFPEASFDSVARIIGPTVYEARAEFGILSGTLPPAESYSRAREAGKLAGKVCRFLVGKSLRTPPAYKFFDSTDGNFLNLLGFDRERGCVRNRIFCCTDRCTESECDYGAPGASIAGVEADPQKEREAVRKLVELVGRERTPKRIIDSMLSLAAEISDAHPETIGPPYRFCLVAKPESHGGSIIGVSNVGTSIEDQFRQALAIVENRAMQSSLSMTRDTQLRTA